MLVGLECSGQNEPEFMAVSIQLIEAVWIVQKQS